MPDPASGTPGEIASREGASLALPGDPISDVLETVRLQGAVFFLWQPVWPYGMSVADGRDLSPYLVPGTDCIVSYHIVTQGPCWAAVSAASPVRLETGDTLVLPRGDPYRISNAPEAPEPGDSNASIEFFKSMSAGDIPPVVRDGGRGPEKNELICGFLGCSMGPWNPLLSSLPRLLRVPAPADGNDPLSSLIAFALSESRQNRGGERCLLMRLSEVMFIEVLRRYLRSRQDPLCGWLGALRDPLVGRALSLLHRNIAAAWTLQELAKSVGASRSTLAERFTRVVGVPPMQYLTRWRMQVAADRLRNTASKIHAIAFDVGYESEEAFSRAFKRVVGTTPGEWRKRV
ncbi:MAG TPA: AraC family transcriptional regulator [Arenicellales bacterium]|nr:AraC family transcriptional regulator [Arenicellales bacterium]